MIDVPGMIRQASTVVSVDQLVKNGKREIQLLSREKIDQLISRAVRNIVARYRTAGLLEDGAAQERMEADSREEFNDLLSQQEQTARAGDDLTQSKQELDAKLREIQIDLAQQRVLADGRLPGELERVMLESRFQQLSAHLAAMHRAVATLFSSKLYTYRQLQALLRQALAARKTAALRAKQAPLRASLEFVMEQPAALPQEKDALREASFDTMELEPGRGLDVGTAHICAAARSPSSGQTVYRSQRNEFLDVRDDEFARKIRRFGIDYIVRGDRGFIIGDAAHELANIFEKTTRRPMRDGMISPEEPDAILIVTYLVAQLLGLPQKAGEVCVYSLPGNPIDADQKLIYHQSALETAIASLGYTPRPMLESHVIVFADLKAQDYTGIGVSCGGGTVNVCAAYKGVPSLAFSTMRGGDWIDHSVATALGMPAPIVCAVKESGMDLRSPQGRVQEAIAIYTRNLIRYTVETMMRKLTEAEQGPTFPTPVPMVCAGGTSMIQGFLEVFREEFDRIDFPVAISEIRLASNPLRAVAAGCLQAAIEESRSENSQ